MVSNSPVSVLCSCRCSLGRWHSFRGCTCSRQETVHCRQSWHREWELSPGPERCHCKQSRCWLGALKVSKSIWCSGPGKKNARVKTAVFCHLISLLGHYSTWPSWIVFYLSTCIHFLTDIFDWKPCLRECNKYKSIISTCEGFFPLLEWAWCSWRPSPSCWPAGPPRPSSCGCSSLEESLPRDSSGTHLLLESGKAWGDHILLISNNKPLLNNFLNCSFESVLLFLTTV